MSYWLQNLNPEQQDAVLHDHGPLLILAGAGSGKTTVLVSRTGRLIDEGIASPDRICVLTFTNKAAHELKTRVVKKVGPMAKKVWTGTFHGFGLQFLKENWKEAGLPKKFGVIDGNDALAILKELMKSHSAYEKERFSMERLMEKISTLRITGRESSLDDTIESVMALVLAPKFMSKMRQLGVVDFEELLLRPLKLMKENAAIQEKMRARYDFVMVDEFQDTNSTQMLLIDDLTASHRNLAVVGDDDQSIYGWRGAEVKNILGFPNRYKGCKTIRLERNYRSSGPIIELANKVISNNRDRHSKILRPGLDAIGDKPELFVYDNENEEVEQIVSELESFHRKGYQWRDMAILYRSNSQGGLIEGGMRRAQIPYKITGGTALFDRKEVKDVLSYIRCAMYPSEVAFRRIINTPPRGVGEKTLDEIELWPGDMEFHKKARAWAENDLKEDEDLKQKPEDLQTSMNLDPEPQASEEHPLIKRFMRDRAELTKDRGASSILNLFEFLKQLRGHLVNDRVSAEDVILREFERIGYRNYVFQSYREAQVADKRWVGVMILGRILDGMFERHGRSYDTLEKFIETMELRDPANEDESEQANEVQMMTLHACKGLEFPLVFLVGVEEELLPHSRLGQDVDEERRLFYVGVTRAKRHLILTRAKQRKRQGRLQPVAPSRFLLELGDGLYTEFDAGRPLAAETRASMVSDLLSKLNKKIAENEAGG